MSVQIPGTSTSIGRGDRAEISPLGGGSSAASFAGSVNGGSGAAARVSLSTTARLAGSFAVRQAGTSTQSTLLRTHSVLAAAYTSLQSESKLYGRTA